MLIVITSDKLIIESVLKESSNAYKWSPIFFLNEGGNPAASVKFKAFLKDLKADESLCITGHGNDYEIGDENISGPQSWTWTVSDLANYLSSSLPIGYSGKIVLEVCSDTANNFASKLAIQLGNLGRIGIEIYGYPGAINISKPFPDPRDLSGLQKYTSKPGVNSALEIGETLPESTMENSSDIPVTFDVDPGSQGSSGAAPNNDWLTEIKKPLSSAEKYNIPAAKYYVVNETGNIMVATTSADTTKIDPDVLAVFQEVSVFFAAMTSAITSTPRHGTSAPYSRSDYYTIYDYDALEAIVSQSGLFVNVREEDLHFTTSSGTVDFNLELIEALLGVALTDGIGAAGLMASMKAMGKQASFSYSRTKQSDKIANILFLCEYMFGMPIVNVLYFYLNEESTDTIVKTPCVSTSFQGYDLDIHKETFMFVLPDWIRKYAGDLTSAMNFPAYQDLISELKGYISVTPTISKVTTDVNGLVVAPYLVTGDYYIFGNNLASKVKGKAGTVSFLGTKQAVTDTDWTDTKIKFTFTKPAVGNEGYIDLLDTDNTLLAETKNTFIIAPHISGVVDNKGKPVDTLTGGSTYTVNGIGFGATKGSVAIFGTASTAQTVNDTDWSDNKITFTCVKPGTDKTGVVRVTDSTSNVGDSPFSFTCA